MRSIFDFSLPDIEGPVRELSDFRNKVLLVVNVASKCGFTPQYAGLESLYREYKDQGFEILGFPCNQFGSQEPGQESDIKAFCHATYDVTFPLFAKVQVNGDSAAPLYQWLKHEKPGLLGTKAIKWNFTKFLLGRDGQVIKRYAPTDTPENIAKDVQTACARTDTD